MATASNRWPYDQSMAPPMLQPICYFSDRCSGAPTPHPSHCKSYFFGSPSGLYRAPAWVGSVSRLLSYWFASPKRDPPLFVGRWRQQNHVYVFFKRGASLSDLLLSSRWGKEADFVPNSPCLTPTCVRDNVKRSRCIFFSFYPTSTVKAVRRGVLATTRWQ